MMATGLRRERGQRTREGFALRAERKDGGAYPPATDPTPAPPDYAGDLAQDPPTKIAILDSQRIKSSPRGSI